MSEGLLVLVFVIIAIMIISGVEFVSEYNYDMGRIDKWMEYMERELEVRDECGTRHHNQNSRKHGKT